MLEGKDRIIPNLECQSYMILSFIVLNNAMLSVLVRCKVKSGIYLVKVNERDKTKCANF